MKYYIYKIVNTVDANEIYIGSTRSIKTRWSVHKTNVKSGCEHALYVRMREIGIDKFSIVELEAIEDAENRRAVEEKYIREYASKGFKMLNMNKAFRTKEELREYQQEKYKQTFCKDIDNYKPREYKKKAGYAKGERTQVIVTNEDEEETTYKSLYACSIALKLNPSQVKQRCESSHSYNGLSFRYGDSHQQLPKHLKKIYNSLQSSLIYKGLSAKRNKEEYKQAMIEKIKNHKKIEKEDKETLYEYLN